MENEYAMIYTTTGSKDEAKTLAKALVEDHLVACVNLLPIDSVYWWDGKIQEDQEYLLLSKTTTENYKKIEEKILKNHSYDCPAITMIPIQNGQPDFLDWIRESTSS